MNANETLKLDIDTSAAVEAVNSVLVKTQKLEASLLNVKALLAEMSVVAPSPLVVEVQNLVTEMRKEMLINSLPRCS